MLQSSVFALLLPHELTLHFYSQNATAVSLHKITAAAAADSLQLCPTLCDPIDGNPLGSPVPGILQARTLEYIAFPSSGVHIAGLMAITYFSVTQPISAIYRVEYFLPCKALFFPSLGFWHTTHGWFTLLLSNPQPPVLVRLHLSYLYTQEYTRTSTSWSSPFTF